MRKWNGSVNGAGSHDGENGRESMRGAERESYLARSRGSRRGSRDWSQSATPGFITPRRTATSTGLATPRGESKSGSVLRSLEKQLENARPWSKSHTNTAESRTSNTTLRTTSCAPSVVSPRLEARERDRDSRRDSASVFSSDTEIPHFCFPSSPGLTCFVSDRRRASELGGGGVGEERLTAGEERSLPSSVSACHDLIQDLLLQLRGAEEASSRQLERKEATLDGISDIFALQALIPDRTRLYKEYNQMKVKYQELMGQLLQARQDLEREKKDGGEREEKLRQAVAESLQSVERKERELAAASDKVMHVAQLREQDAQVAVSAVESATKRADACQARLRELELKIKGHPRVVAEGLGDLDVDEIVPRLLQRAAERLEEVEEVKERAERAEEEEQRMQSQLARTKASTQRLEEARVLLARDLAEAKEQLQASNSAVQDLQDKLRAKELGTKARTRTTGAEEAQGSHVEGEEVELKDLRERVKTLQGGLEDKEEEMKSLRERVQDLEEELKQAEAHAAAARAEAGEKERERREREKERERREREEETEEETEEEARWREREAENERTLQELTAQLCASKEEASALEKEVEAVLHARRSMAEATAQIEALQQENDVLQQENDVLQQDKGALQQEKDALQQRADALQQRSEVLQEENGTLQKDKELLRERTDDLQREKEALAQAAEVLQQATDELQQRRAVLEQEKEALDQQQEALQQRNDFLHQQTEALQQQKESLQLQNDVLQTQQTEALEGGRKEAVAREEAENVRNVAESIRTEAENARAEAETARKEARNAHREAESMRTEAGNARQEAEKVRKEAENAYREAENIRAEAENAQEKAENAIERGRIELGEREEEVLRLTQRVEEAEREARATAEEREREREEWRQEREGEGEEWKREREREREELGRELQALQEERRSLKEATESLEAQVLQGRDLLAKAQDSHREEAMLLRKRTESAVREVEARYRNRIVAMEDSVARDRIIAAEEYQVLHDLNSVLQTRCRVLEEEAEKNAVSRKAFDSAAQATSERASAASRAHLEASTRLSEAAGVVQSLLAEVQEALAETQAQEEEGRRVDAALREREREREREEREREREREEIEQEREKEREEREKEMEEREKERTKEMAKQREKEREIEREEREKERERETEEREREREEAREREKERERKRERELEQLRESSRALESKLQSAEEEMSAMSAKLAEHKNLVSEVFSLKQAQADLEAALVNAREDREQLELQAHDAMNLVAEEMRLVREECALLEEQLDLMKRQKVRDSEEIVRLNTLLEQHAKQQDKTQAAIMASLKAADTELSALKASNKKLQDDLATEVALRERDREEYSTAIDTAKHLRQDLQERDRHLEALRREALQLKAEALVTPQRGRTPRSPLEKQASSPALMGGRGLEGEGAAREGEKEEAGEGERELCDSSQWEAIMLTGKGQLSAKELEVLGKERKLRLEQQLSAVAKKEIAEAKALNTAPETVCRAWHALFVLLGHPDLDHAADVGQPLDWKALKKLINTNPAQFDKASLFGLMERFSPTESTPDLAGTARARAERAQALLLGVDFPSCCKHSVTCATVYEWERLALDLHSLHEAPG